MANKPITPEEHMIDLLRRAWDTLDTFKQAYPENWHEEDEQVLRDLLRADLKMSGVNLNWQGLTEEEKQSMVEWAHPDIIDAIELKLRERNT